MKERPVDQGIAKEKDWDAPALAWIWKSFKCFQDACFQQKLRKSIQKATCRRQNAVAFAPLQCLYYLFSVLDKDSPLSLMICDRLPPLLSVPLPYTFFLIS
jgi:hypothetical protein